MLLPIRARIPLDESRVVRTPQVPTPTHAHATERRGVDRLIFLKGGKRLLTAEEALT